MAEAVGAVNTALNVAIIGGIGFGVYELYRIGFFDFLKNTGSWVDNLFGSHGGGGITGKDGKWWLCKLSGYCPPDDNSDKPNDSTNPDIFQNVKTICENYGTHYISYNASKDTYSTCGRVRLTSQAIAWIRKMDNKYGRGSVVYYFSADWAVIYPLPPGYDGSTTGNDHDYFDVIKNQPHVDPNEILLPILTNKITYNTALGTYYCDNMSFSPSAVAFLNECRLDGLTYKLTPDHNFLTGSNAFGTVKKKFSIVGDYEMTNADAVDARYVKFQQECHSSGGAIKTDPHGDGAINICALPNGSVKAFNKITGQIIENYV